MMNHKTLHDADAAMLSELPRATGFVTSIFLGRGQYATHESTSLQDARAVAEQMAAHYRNGRKALVYAQLPSGRQFLVPDAYQPEGETTMPTDTATTETMKTFNKRFNAQRAAKSALGKDAEEGKEFQTVKNEMGLWEYIRLGGPDGKLDAAQPEAEAAEQPAEYVNPDGATVDYIDPEFAAFKAEREKRIATNRKGGAKKAAAKRSRPAEGDPLTPPDFSAKTHERFRGKLAALVALVEARDIAGIKRFHVNPSSTSPKAIMRYKERALAALEAR